MLRLSRPGALSCGVSQTVPRKTLEIIASEESAEKGENTEKLANRRPGEPRSGFRVVIRKANMPALGGCQTGSIAEKKHVTASVHDTQSPGVGKSRSPRWLPRDRPRTARAIMARMAKMAKIATTTPIDVSPNHRESGSTRGRGRVRELASDPFEQTPKRQEPTPDTIFLLTRAE